MKSYITLIIILAAVIVLPQNRFKRGDHGPFKKLNQLEKVKLLEILDLDDATAVKFFNLKDQHQKNMMDLRDKSDEILDLIEETLDGNDSKKTSSLSKLVEDYEANELEMTKLRINYLNDVQALLSIEKYAKYLVFDRKFKDEVRDLIMGDRKTPHKP